MGRVRIALSNFAWYEIAGLWLYARLERSIISQDMVEGDDCGGKVMMYNQQPRHVTYVW